MKLGVFDPLFGALELDAFLDRAADLGLEAVEIACGGYVGDAHCRPAELLADDEALARFRESMAGRGLELSALSCHGNPLHPDPEQAARFHEAWRNAVRLAAELGVTRVVTFSGCPGGGPEDRTPNWHVCPWPTDHADSLAWQWRARVEPYWREEAAFAFDHGVRVAVEMHPGFVVYNPETMLRLREAVPGAAGDAIGCNFDPSHLFWQGVDPVRAVRALGELILHVHAKDTALDPVNAPVDGVLDTKSYGDVAGRSWIFRTVGYGHGEATWRNLVSALRTVGYDFVLSIEHEDALASPDEGLRKAVEVLKSAVLSEPAGEAWWT